MHIWGKKSLHSKTMQAKFKVKRKLYRYFCCLHFSIQTDREDSGKVPFGLRVQSYGFFRRPDDKIKEKKDKIVYISKTDVPNLIHSFNLGTFHAKCNIMCAYPATMLQLRPECALYDPETGLPAVQTAPHRP